MTKKLDYSAEAIRIGTLVGGAEKPAAYIRQILPHGFESFQITFWKTLGQIDLPQVAAEVKDALADSGAIISSLELCTNPLVQNADGERAVRDWEKMIDHARDFGADLVCGFTGRVPGCPLPDSLPRFRKVFGELARRAADQGVRIAFENCSMGGDWSTGDWNIAHSPDAWELMFDAVPSPNLGLEWEPCHQLCHLIDPMAQLREWASRIFHVHGKDASVYRDVIARHGLGGSRPTVEHRHPGFGDSNWTDIISELRRVDYRGTIDIEGWHDPIYKGPLEMTGQVAALHHLKRCRGNHFVPNPIV